MGNRTYLVALNDRVICPGYRAEYELDYKAQTIGETASHLPLPWLAMFREPDLAEDTFIDANSGEQLTQIAPITTRAKAITNLKTAFKAFSTAFDALEGLQAYFLLMAQELETFDFPFVTIDWLELDEPAAHEGYIKDWHTVLRGFDDPEAVEAENPQSAFDGFLSLLGRKRVHPWLRAINAFTEFDPLQKLPRASAYIEGGDLTVEEDKIHARLLPGGEYRRSIWRPERA